MSRCALCVRRTEIGNADAARQQTGDERREYDQADYEFYCFHRIKRFLAPTRGALLFVVLLSFSLTGLVRERDFNEFREFLAGLFHVFVVFCITPLDLHSLDLFQG